MRRTLLALAILIAAPPLVASTPDATVETTVSPVRVSTRSPGSPPVRAADPPPPAPVEVAVYRPPTSTLGDPPPVLSSAALAVAACESGVYTPDGTAVLGSHDWTAENPTSSASGAFQFIDGTWTATTGLPAPASAYPPEIQTAAFDELWADGAGASHWSPSRSCWSRLVYED